MKGEKREGGNQQFLYFKNIFIKIIDTARALCVNIVDAVLQVYMLLPLQKFEFAYYRKFLKTYFSHIHTKMQKFMQK